MKRLLLIGGGVVGGLIVIIAIVLYFVFSSLDSIIKAAVEKYGSEVTQVDVRLDHAKVSITSGEGALRGLTVGNPDGFKSDHAFSLGEISVELDVGTVTQNPVVIKKIVITAPEVTYELGSRGSNIDVIQRNANAYGGSGKGKAKVKKQSPSSGGDQEGRKLVIQNLYIRKGKVNISSPMLKDQKLSAELQTIHLKDIGKKRGGAVPSEVVEILVKAIGQSSVKAAGTLDLNKVLGLAGMKGQIGGAEVSAESVKKTVEDAKSVGGAFKKMLDK